MTKITKIVFAVRDRNRYLYDSASGYYFGDSLGDAKLFDTKEEARVVDNGKIVSVRLSLEEQPYEVN